MRRYFLDPSTIVQDQVHIQGESFHHIFDVCRNELGSQFEILTGEHKAYFVKVIRVGRKEAIAQILETRPLSALQKPHVHLLLCFPKLATFESVLEKSVEMGVQSIYPLISEHSYFKKIESVPVGKWERFEKIILQATQQSGRGDLMRLLQPQPLISTCEHFNRDPSNLCLFAFEGDVALTLSSFVNRHKNQKLENIFILVGSEGGFSQNEVQCLESLGLEPVSLGPQILRVETACMSLVSILKYEFVTGS